MPKTKNDEKIVYCVIEATPNPGAEKLEPLPDPKPFYKKFIAQFLKMSNRAKIKPHKGPSH